MSSETISTVATIAAPQQATALPTIDQIATGLNGQAPVVPAEAAPEANQWEVLTEQQRNVFREKENARKEKLRLDQQKQEQDARFATLENVVDEYMGTDPENQPGDAQFDPEKYKKELRDEIMKDVKGFQQESIDKQAEDKQVTEFKTGVSTFLDEKASDFPLSSSMKQADLVFEIIEQQYQKDIEEFGQEYATQNMLTKEAASKKSEEHLASEVTKMLQSESVRTYLLNQINGFGNADGQQSVTDQSMQGNKSIQSPVTLTNNLAQTSAQTQFIDETIETDDQAFQRALSLIP